MKKLCLKIDAEVFTSDNKKTNKKFKELMSLERHYCNAEFEINELNNRVTNVFGRFGPKITNLTFHGGEYQAGHAVLSTLNFMPELEVLTLESCYCLDCSCCVDSVVLKKLKKLVLKSGWGVLKVIEAPLLVELQTSGFTTDSDTKKFLKACTKLEVLEIELECLAQMGPDFPFKLKKLVSPDYVELNENIRKFLLSQAETVETLEVDCNNSEFHEFVLTKFTRLKSLKSNLQRLNAALDFYKNSKPCLS